MSNIRVRQLSGVRAVAGTPSDDDLAAIAVLAGRDVAADEVFVRTMRLAHNQHDRCFERFPKAYLDRFSETLPGKGVLIGHNYGTVPVGRFFRARTVQRTEQGFPMLVRDSEGRVTNPPTWEPQDLRVLWTEPTFYCRSGSDMQQDMDLGILRDVSIGFRFDDLDCDVCKASYFSYDCPHIIGYDWNTEPGQIVTGTYAGDPKASEALEGSIVWLGAQQGARLVKAFREGNIDPQALAATPFGDDLVALKEAEAYARRWGHQRKSWAFPGLTVPAAAKDALPVLVIEEQPSTNTVLRCPHCREELPERGSLYLVSQDPEVWQHRACGGKFTWPEGKSSPFGDGKRPPVGGKSDPAPVGAPKRKDGDPTMPMTEEEKAAFEAAQKRATDAEAALAAERARAETAEGERDTAKGEATEKAGLATVGEQALKDIKQAILDDDFRLTNQKENPELADLLDQHVERRNYGRLKEIAAAKRKAVLEKFPATTSADPAGDSGPAPTTVEDVRRLVI